MAINLGDSRRRLCEATVLSWSAHNAYAASSVLGSAAPRFGQKYQQSGSLGGGMGVELEMSPHKSGG